MEMFAFTNTYLMMLVRLLISFIFTWIIIDRMYYAKSHRRDFRFTFMLISVAIFFIVFFMIFVLEDMKGKTSMGVGIGLFGIFSIMRYRTDTMPVREMTYLFITIALAVVNAVSVEVPLTEVLFTNIIVTAAVWVCEKQLNMSATKLIQYDRIELVHPDRHDELKADLEKRLGLKVTNIEVGAIDFLKDMAMLKVTYEGDAGSATDHMMKLSKSQLAALLVLFLMLPVGTQAQSDNFGTWTSVSLDKQFSKRFTLGTELELRTGNNLKNIDRWSAGVSMDYRLAKWLKASAGYTYLYDYHPEAYTYQDDGDLNKRTMTYFGSRHRLNASLTATKDFGKLSISLRERWQYTYRPEQENKRMDYQHATLGYSYPVKGKASNVWRNRLQLKYKATSLLQPYLYGETYVGGSGLDKLRLSLGTELKLSKKNSLNVSYVYQKAYDNNDDEGNKHILSIGYKYKF